MVKKGRKAGSLKSVKIRLWRALSAAEVVLFASIPSIKTRTWSDSEPRIKTEVEFPREPD